MEDLNNIEVIKTQLFLLNLISNSKIICGVIPTPSSKFVLIAIIDSIYKLSNHAFQYTSKLWQHN